MGRHATSSPSGLSAPSSNEFARPASQTIQVDSEDPDVPATKGQQSGQIVIPRYLQP